MFNKLSGNPTQMEQDSFRSLGQCAAEKVKKHWNSIGKSIRYKALGFTLFGLALLSFSILWNSIIVTSLLTKAKIEANIERDKLLVSQIFGGEITTQSEMNRKIMKENALQASKVAILLTIFQLLTGALISFFISYALQ